MGSDSSFRDSLGLGGNSTRGAAYLLGKFFLTFFLLGIILVYRYFLINCLIYIYIYILFLLISYLIYSLNILFSL